MTRYRWVTARKAEGFPTTLCCDVAGVGRQGFYGWRASRGEPTERERAEAALVAEIREIWAGSGEAYGSPRVTAELRSRGHRVNVKRVARLMKAHHIAGIRPRRRKRTTIPARCAPKLPDLLGRRFAPGAPDRAWCSDITYIRTGEGWLYLAVVLDVGSRRLLGYALSDRIDTRLVQDALDMAAHARGGRTAGIVFHTDWLNLVSTSPASSVAPPPAGGSPSQWAVSGHRPTTPWPRRSSPASSGNSSTGAATPTAPPAASSSGQRSGQGRCHPVQGSVRRVGCACLLFASGRHWRRLVV